MSDRPAIDAALLPPKALDARSPLWWGNMLMLSIESTTVALLLVSYFYLQQNFEQWPPPSVDTFPPLKNPVPDLPAGTLNVFLQLASLPLMVWIDRAARRVDERRVKFGLVALGLLGLLLVLVRLPEFSALKFSWDDNAYGSTVWALLALHWTYLVVGALEILVLAAWSFAFGLDESLASDTTITAGYWYWMVGAGLVIYLVVYWYPRIV